MKSLKAVWLLVRLGLVLVLTGCGQTQDISPIASGNSAAATTLPATATPTAVSSSASQTVPPSLSSATTAANSPTGTSGLSTTSQTTAAANNSTLPSTPLPIGHALKTIADIPLPGNTSRFDYQSFDPKTGKLFMAHLGDSQLLVFDTQANQVVSKVEGLGGIHGVVVVPELGRVFATATSEHQLVVIDETSLKVITRLPAGNYPDGLAYDPINHKVYISDEGGSSEPVIDTQANKALPSIPLGGEAGNTQYDPVSGHIFVAGQSHNELVEIDPITDKVVARYQLPGCQSDHSLQLDPAQRLAFVACEGNAKLLVLDMQQGMKLLTTQDVGTTPDVLALDSEKYLLYVACESGNVSIFNVSRPSIQKIGDGFLVASAHTIAVDPRTHRVYLPLENVGGKPVLRIMEPSFS